MQRLFSLMVLLVLVTAGATAQVTATPQPGADTMRRVELIYADRVRIEQRDSVTEVQILAGKVHLKQEKTQFFCDSAIYNKFTKIVEAFGHIHINDADSVHTYSDYLLYHVDTKQAVLTKNAKLTDGKTTLLTDELHYDANQKIGEYFNGGKVLNNKSVLTSREATYYGELKDVYFKKDVVMIDPAYKLKADSLLYNTGTEVATFITKTNIEDSAQRKITTREGYYDIKNKKASFGSRPIMEDTRARTKTIADFVDTNDSTGVTTLVGRAVHIDSAQGVSVLANYMWVNKKEESFFATQNPLMIIKQDKDSIYVTADSLFSGRLSKLKQAVKIDTAAGKTDTLKRAVTMRTKDRLDHDSAGHEIARINANQPDSGGAVTVNANRMDSVEAVSVNVNRPDSGRAVSTTANRPDSAGVVALQTDTASRKADTARKIAANAVKANARKNVISGVVNKGNKADNVNKIDKVDTIKGAVTIDTKEKAKRDSADRYFMGYHHVRIFSDSLQAVADSMFYSGADSVFQLFTDPIAWANNSQITGDTMYLYTKNKKPERLYVFENGFAVNKVGKDMYNQLRGNRVNGYFKEGNIDYIRSKGNAQSVFYVMDKDSALVGINKAEGDIIDLRFVNKELNKVVVISEPKATMFPAKQASEQDKVLRNFRWLEARRPKTKYELFGN